MKFFHRVATAHVLPAVIMVAFLPLGAAWAQGIGERLPPREALPMPPDMRHDPSRVGGLNIMALRQRLMELDRLLMVGNGARAAGLLEELAQHSALERELVPRRIDLAQLQGNHESAVAMCRVAVAEQPRNPGLWRELASSLLALDKPDSARLALEQFLVMSHGLRSSAVVSVEMLRKAGHPKAALAMIDSLRTVLDEKRFLGLERSCALLHLGRQEEAAGEVGAELVASPYNFPLLRMDLLEGAYQPNRMDRFVAQLTRIAREPGAPRATSVLVANLMVADGNAPDALAMVEPIAAAAEGVLLLLQNAAILLREIDQEPVDMPPTAASQAAVDFLLGVLEQIVAPKATAGGLRQRAADLLAEACEQALVRRRFGVDPRAAAARFEDLLDVVRAAHPTSEFLYSSQIRLAVYRRDVLGEAAAAARPLERMALDMGLPTEGLAMIRLTLGECYLAAGDTARGRLVLTSLGRDPEFRKAGGNAHYHLARLDLAEGHFATARDRFAVIALENPAAPYANDALDLALAIAEEMENPTGGPAILALYARAVYADLTSRPAAHLEAMQAFVAEAATRLDPAEPQHLLERGRYELALLLAAAARPDEAVAQLDRIVSAHPGGRYPAAALQLRGRLMRDAGRAGEARDTWEQLLSQYPGFLFVDDVRDELRRLPN